MSTRKSTVSVPVEIGQPYEFESTRLTEAFGEIDLTGGRKMIVKAATFGSLELTIKSATTRCAEARLDLEPALLLAAERLTAELEGVKLAPTPEMPEPAGFWMVEDREFGFPTIEAIFDMGPIDVEEPIEVEHVGIIKRSFEMRLEADPASGRPAYTGSHDTREAALSALAEELELRRAQAVAKTATT